MLLNNIPTVYDGCMDQISKKISLRSAQISRMLDEAQNAITECEKEIMRDYWLLGNSLLELRQLGKNQ